METPPDKKSNTETPPAIIPKHELRKRLRERIQLKGLRRSSNVKKKLVFDNELKKVGLSGDKFREAMKTNLNAAKMEKVISRT